MQPRQVLAIVWYTVCYLLREIKNVLLAQFVEGGIVPIILGLPPLFEPPSLIFKDVCLGLEVREKPGKL